MKRLKRSRLIAAGMSGCGKDWRAAVRLLWLLVLIQHAPAQAGDAAAPTQKAGDHSTVATSDGEIRDDELVEFICQKIKDNGGKVKDVKLMANSSYGGGLLDDMERVFGPAGACPGIPWVGGSASAPEQAAQGWSPAVVQQYSADKLGSTWTDGLAGTSSLNVVSKNGTIRSGSSTNKVLQDLQATEQNDNSASKGDMSEAPQAASGNGGDMIMWNMPAARHEAVVFGGLQTDQRHHNNVDNVEAALNNTWSGSPHTIRKLDGGSKQNLLDAIATAVQRLDENTQLVIYLDGHGGSSFDFDEAIGAIANVLIEDPVSIPFELHDGWFEGMFGNYFGRPSEMPAPYLLMDIDQCNGCSNWQYLINGHALMLQGGDATGIIQLSFPFTWLRPGENMLDIVPLAPGSAQSGGNKPQAHFGSLVVSRLELSTGPINDLLADQILLPAQSAAFFDPNRSGEGIFVELLGDGRAVVYVFSYTPEGPGQSWMVGVGRQVGEGIIFNEMLLPTGATFGSGFDPGDMVLTDFGSLAFHLPTCETSAAKGSLFVYPEPDTNYGLFGSDNYIQLSVLVDCKTDVGSANSPLSGSWFDPTHNGEGIILEVLKNGTAVVQWFTYDHDGKQMWIQGTGTFDGDTLTVNDLFTTQGTHWGSGFDPNAITTAAWGTLTMEFTGCGQARLDYVSTAGFGSGTLNMVRLTNLMGITCLPCCPPVAHIGDPPCQDCGLRCLSAGSRIATPSGERPVETLKIGDLVLSMHQGIVSAVPIKELGRQEVLHHRVVQLELSNGKTIELSATHPTIDGSLAGDLQPGAMLGDVAVIAKSTVSYAGRYTYDILPDSDTGTYMIGGAWMGSTLYYRGQARTN